MNLIANKINSNKCSFADNNLIVSCINNEVHLQPCCRISSINSGIPIDNFLENPTLYLKNYLNKEIKVCSNFKINHCTESQTFTKKCQYIKKPMSNIYRLNLGLYNICNFKCKMCRIPMNVESDNYLRKFLNNVEDLSMFEEVCMSGVGEITLFDMYYLISRLIQLNVHKLSLITNGYIDISDIIKKYMKDIDINMTISLHSLNGNTEKLITKVDSLDNVLSTIRNYYNLKCIREINCVIQQDNLLEINDFIIQMKNMFSNIKLNMLIDQNETEYIYKKLDELNIRKTMIKYDCTLDGVTLI